MARCRAPGVRGWDFMLRAGDYKLRDWSRSANGHIRARVYHFLTACSWQTVEESVGPLHAGHTAAIMAGIVSWGGTIDT